MIEGEREEPRAPVLIPAALSDGLAEYRWARDRVGESGAAVYRLHGKHDVCDAFLKHGRGSVADDITDEMVRLRWLAPHLPVPSVLHFARTPDEAWLLMTGVPGRTAYECLAGRSERAAEVIDALATFLRRLHAVPISACPFTSDHRHRLVLARARIDAGLVDEDDFDDERRGWSAEDVWDALQHCLPFAPDPVVTHGDFSLDNILMLDGEVVGCIDVGRAGVADRYQDLAILWSCLAEFDPSLQHRLLACYGITEVDERKLRFHLLLDELF